MQKPIHTGDLLARGAGPDAARREQMQALARRNAALGQDAMTAALQVIDDDVWRFVIWYRTVEARALRDGEDGGLPSYASGATGSGVPLSPCQRIAIELPMLLSRMCDDPETVIEMLDKCDGLW